MPVVIREFRTAWLLMLFYLRSLQDSIRAMQRFGYRVSLKFLN